METRPPPTPDAIAAAGMKLLVSDPLFKVGMARIRGNDYRVFENAPPSLVGIFLKGASFGDRDFLYYRDETWSHGAVWREACRFANALREAFGVGKGDRIAIAMRNYPEWCAAYMGIISLGAVVVPLNAWWTEKELKFALADCAAKIVIVDAARLESIGACKDALSLTLVLARGDDHRADHLYSELIAGASDAAPPMAAIDPEDDFAIYYTSGSTGRPKGVILTHRGAISTLMSWAFVASAIREANGGVSIFGDNPGVLLGIPLFHVTGTHAIFLMSLIIGRRIAMIDRWDSRHAVQLINRHALTNFTGVPSQSFELIDAASDTPMPSLIDIGSGGAKRPAPHVEKLVRKFPGANPSSGYGLSETNALGALISLSDYQKRPDSTGRAVPPICDIRIMGEAGVARTGEIGEVEIRSAANFRGYLNLPEDTAASLTPDGWFRSGDLGRLDEEGFLYIVDRIKDLIIRGGENISCLEVEARALEHEGVAEAQAFAVPDEVLGELVGLVVVAKEGETLDAGALRDFMAKELARFKCPERIWLSPGRLPRLGTEKFDKQTIRRAALAHPPAWSGG